MFIEEQWKYSATTFSCIVIDKIRISLVEFIANFQTSFISSNLIWKHVDYYRFTINKCSKYIKNQS